ncbi:hypothetical protein KO481_12470 [Nocardia sp. NEAU-G5]|uniref:Ricin B lectin domain-containing protein n=1 Tax=Nocardia albiluteola TaxID=2842303 RepID=A0ABS6AWB8_9NOCA|nr:hypothetical protein [Nocardia albiluteola]MBU3062337.1 hypothetical protein [Nocardia albiluteola]
MSSGGFVHIRQYDGTQDQSFDIVAQADGSKGIRHKYYGVALSATAAGGVSVRPYSGLADQSFSFNTARDGRFIRLFYDTRHGVMKGGMQYTPPPVHRTVEIVPTQSIMAEAWVFVDQADGSTGLRVWES